MCESLGTRVRKQVVREGFLDEVAFEQLLMKVYGVTAEELEDDVASRGSMAVFYTGSAAVRLPDGKMVTLCAKPGDGLDVLEYLEKLPACAVSELWKNEENRRAIGALIRNPGGLHEWLMVASLPLLKRMGIPLAWIRIYRTETNSCTFDFMEKGEWTKGIHGGPGSGRMHNDLFYCYSSAYHSFQNGECIAGKGAQKLIQKNLLRFQEKYFQKTEPPKEFVDLVKMLD